MYLDIPGQGYEEFVGSKTTIRFLNEALTKRYRDSISSAISTAIKDCILKSKDSDVERRVVASAAKKHAKEILFKSSKQVRGLKIIGRVPCYPPRNRLRLHNSCGANCKGLRIPLVLD
jgi:hypothetical protein